MFTYMCMKETGCHVSMYTYTATSVDVSGRLGLFVLYTDLISDQFSKLKKVNYFNILKWVNLN